jgi:hypothetical protein
MRKAKQKAWKYQQTGQEKGAAYLKNRGASCLHCGGSIEGSSMDFNGGEIVQKISCTDCGENWNDIYTLTAITTRDGKTIASMAIPEEKTGEYKVEKKDGAFYVLTPSGKTIAVPHKSKAEANTVARVFNHTNRDERTVKTATDSNAPFLRSGLA